MVYKHSYAEERLREFEERYGEIIETYVTGGNGGQDDFQLIAGLECLTRDIEDFTSRIAVTDLNEANRKRRKNPSPLLRDAAERIENMIHKMYEVGTDAVWLRKAIERQEFL